MSAATAALASCAALAMTAGPAAAMSAPIKTTTSVNVRPGPSTGSGNPLTVMPPGTSPDFNCWTQGQNIGGVNVWFSVNYHGVTGYYASYYDNSSYSTDSQITSKYGIPHCGSARRTPPTGQPPTSARTTTATSASPSSSRPGLPPG